LIVAWGNAVLIAVLRRASEVNLPALHLVLGLLIASGCWVALSRARRPIAAWVALIICSVAWLRVDRLREGRILLVFTPFHGLTEADLLVPVVVCAAIAVSGLRGIRRRRGAHRI
jgi:hypothetical protein